MNVKTERITILGTPAFKAFLNREAKNEGVSISQLVRQRCEKNSSNADSELLFSLVGQVSDATASAKESLENGIREAEKVLAELRRLK